MKAGRHPIIKDSDFLEVYNEGAIDAEMSEIFGVSRGTIKRQRDRLGLEVNPRYNRFRKQFVAYDRETKELLATGNMTEISKATGIAEPTLFVYASAVRNDYRPVPKILIYEVENGGH